MPCCYEAGQVIVLPREGGKHALYNALKGGEDPDPEVLYSVEDILENYFSGENDEERKGNLPIRFGAFPTLVRVPPGTELAYAARYRESPAVRTALPNLRISPSLAGLSYNQQVMQDGLATAGLSAAAPMCGTGVRIAVLDSGVDATVFNGRALPQQFDTDTPRNAAIPRFSPYDTTGHGTVVATIILHGAPGAEITPIKVYEGTVGNLMATVSGLYVAIAAGPPDIFNLSLGVELETGSCGVCGQPTGTPVTLPQLSLLFSEVDDIYRYNGLEEPLIIAAAGNVLPQRPLLPPACLDGILAVGAYDDDSTCETPSKYSQYGAVPTDRFIRAAGGIDDVSRCFATLPKLTKQWTHKHFFGTSFATPIVTAVAARYLCALRGSPCSPPLVATWHRREFMLECIRQGARCSFPVYSPSVHGLGLVHYRSDVAASVAARNPANAVP